MGRLRSRRPTNETYRRTLQTWAIEERARLNDISQRLWAEKIREKTGVKISYTPIGNWLNADTELQEEMSDNSLLALSRWRGDPSPEHTRRWLWGGEVPSVSDRLGTMRSLLQQSSTEELIDLIREGLDLLAKSVETPPLPAMPAIALKARDRGISIKKLIDTSMLDDDEIESAIAYLVGKQEAIADHVLDDLNFTLDRLIERSSSKIPAGIL
jgi:hypothetical protein